MLSELKTRLGSELERLAQELSARAVAGDGAAPADRRPSAGDGADGMLQDRVRRLGQLVAALPRIDPATIWPDRAGFGSTVRLRELATGEELSYTLLAGEFIDVDAGEVSLASPIGHALLGRRAGEEITVATPRGERRFRILSLTTLPQMLGISNGVRPPRAAG
jgi:transcription elongation factor GreA